MWNSLPDLLWHLDLETQNRFAQLQMRFGRKNATLALMGIGAGLGATATFYVYLAIALLLMLGIHAHDPMLVFMFLIFYLFIGTLQGLWLGAACGVATAFRAQRRRSEAGIACWLGSLPYLLLLIWAYLHSDGPVDTLPVLVYLCGVPVLWAVGLACAGVRLICMP